MADPVSSAPELPAPRPRPRKRRWLVRLVGALVLLPVIALIAVVGVLATLPTWVSPERVRQEVVAAAHEALGVEVELASLDYHLSWGLELRDLRIGPPAGFTRDVLRLGGLDLRWTLPWRADGAVVISRAALIEPHVVIETLNGVRNLDRLVPPSKEPPAPEPPPSAPLRGPLSPVVVVLTDIAVERAALEVVGEGPNLSVEGLSLRLDARLDPQQLTAQLALTSTRAPVAAALPQPDGTRQRITTALDTSVKLVVEADTHDGLRLSRTRLDVDLRTAQLDPHGAPPIPPADLRVRAGLELRADTDTLVVAPLALELDGHRLVELGARVDGVVAAAAEVLADPSSLVASLGLVRSARDGRLQITGPGVVLALEPLMPYVRAFAPTLTVGGEVRLVVDELAGRLPELMALRPSAGSVRLELDQVRVSDPAQRLVVGQLDGALALRAEGSRPITLGGEVRGSGLSAQSSGVDTLALRLSGAVAAPSYPATGTTSIAVSLALEGVRAPGAQVSALDAKLTLGGARSAGPGAQPPRSDPARPEPRHPRRGGGHRHHRAVGGRAPRADGGSARPPRDACGPPHPGSARRTYRRRGRARRTGRRGAGGADHEPRRSPPRSPDRRPPGRQARGRACARQRHDRVARDAHHRHPRARRGHHRP